MCGVRLKKNDELGMRGRLSALHAPASGNDLLRDFFLYGGARGLCTAAGC